MAAPFVPAETLPPFTVIVVGPEETALIPRLPPEIVAAFALTTIAPLLLYT